jgi:integrase
VVRDIPATLTPDQVKKLFRQLEKDCPRTIPWNAIRCFAGVRSEAAKGIRKAEINLTARALTIHPFRNKSRGKREYLEDCGVNLWPWLEKYLPLVDLADPDSIFTLRMAKETREAAAKAGIPMPKNCFRHTFATMHLALHQDPGKTALQLGHKDSPRMLHQHYRGLGTSKEAGAFFRILPRKG